MDLVWHIKTCSLSVLGLVNVVNLPFLAELISQLSNTYVLAFTILLVQDLNHSVVFHIFEVVLRELELLEPSSVRVPDLQVICVTCALDV